MMKKILTLTTLFAALLTLVGCEKTEDDTPDGMIEIFAESMNGGSKVILDGLNATWRSGDEIRINDSTATVERCGDRAYISDASISEGTNRALYPASLPTVNWGTDNPTITFPAYYHYRTDGDGHQVLDLPMAAYSTGSTPLQFKHLTGALYITVKNTSASTRTIQSVTVKSNTYALNGNMNVAMNTTSLISARGDANAKYRCVTLVFDEVVNLATNASVQVMIPILPVGSDNKFTIEVKSYEEGQTTSYLSSKSQTSEADHSLARNQLGYAPMDIPVGETTTPVLTDNGAHMYEIRSATDFVKMTEAINNSWLPNDAKYYLTCDLDMQGISVTPINNKGYTGTLDGKHHSVNNLTINSIRNGDSVFCALFKIMRPAVKVKNISFNNLNLINGSVGSSKLYVGAIEACNTYTNNSSIRYIDSCFVSINTINDGGASGNVYIGGLIGYNESLQLNLTKCDVVTTNFTIHGNNIWWGGIVGQTSGSNSTTILSSSWIDNGAVSVNASSYLRLGGLVGQKAKGSFAVSDCMISAEIGVAPCNYYIGSLIGNYNDKTRATISNVDTSGFSVSVNGSPISVNYFGNQNKIQL